MQTMDAVGSGPGASPPRGRTGSPSRWSRGPGARRASGRGRRRGGRGCPSRRALIAATGRGSRPRRRRRRGADRRAGRGRSLAAWPGERSSCGSRQSRPARSPWRRRTSWMPGDAAGERVAGVEERGVRVGELVPQGEEAVHAPLVASARRDRISSRRATASLRPDRPLAEEAARRSDTRAPAAEVEIGQEVGHDRVVVPGVEGDLARATALGQGPRHVEGRVAVEGRHLDRDHRRRSPGSRARRRSRGRGRRPRAAGRSRRGGSRRRRAGSARAARRYVASRRAARLRRPGVVAEVAGELGLRERLRRGAADPRDLRRAAARSPPRGRAPTSTARASTGRSSADLADRELRRVHAHRDAARPRVAVVAGERHLPPLVELAVRGQGERVGGDHAPRAGAWPRIARSESAIGPLELRGLAEAAPARLDPARRPLDEPVERDLGLPEPRHGTSDESAEQGHRAFRRPRSTGARPKRCTEALGEHRARTGPRAR